jgi:hypothetical protein
MNPVRTGVLGWKVRKTYGEHEFATIPRELHSLVSVAEHRDETTEGYWMVLVLV